jgi:sulfur-carrier protein adenylyltransferase/sulfurtransferase
MRELGPAAVQARLAADDPPVLLDVREDWEVETAAIDGALHVPLAGLADALDGLPDRPLVVFCHHGGRSYSAALMLERAGFDVVNLAGGIDAWSREVDAAVPTY